MDDGGREFRGELGTLKIDRARLTRSRKTPNANIRVAHQAARTAHIANAALRAGRAVRWNDGAGRVES